MLQIEHVLLPTDRTAWSKSVFEHALFYASRHDARLHTLTETWGEPDPALHALPPDAFRGSLHEAPLSAGVDLVRMERRALSPGTGILNAAEEIDADLIVMATHGRRGLRRLVIGSVAEEVVRLAP